jgi:Flp pilus assembly protein TadD
MGNPKGKRTWLISGEPDEKLNERQGNSRCFFALLRLRLLPVKKFGFLAILLLLLAAALAWSVARPAYHRRKEAHWLAQAQQFFVHGDFRKASLAARRTLQLNPANVAACTLLAEIGQKAKSPAELDWRRKIVDLSPTLDHKLNLAACALRLQPPPFPLAGETLEEVAGTADQKASYHCLRAELALKTGQMDAAAAEFSHAASLEPTNAIHRLNVAVLQLRSTNGQDAVGARASLETLAREPGFREAALRWLITDCLQRGELGTAMSYSSNLLSSPKAALEDRLQHLTILQQGSAPDCLNYLSQVGRDVRTNAVSVYGLTTWMLGHKMVDEAYVYLTNCPAAVRAEQPAPLALVNCLMAKRDWDGLEKYLQNEKWREQEFLRFAFLSRAAEQQNSSLAAATRWRSALRAAEDKIGPLTALLTAAAAWGRDKDRQDVLWAINERCPRERWALRELARAYQAERNTRGLNRVYAAMASYNSKSFVIKNDFAATSMLLKANLSDAHRLAKEIYTEHPEESVVASTYAWSLHLQGRTREALGVLEKLDPGALEQPNVALYYGLLLSAAGETNKASKFLELAQQSPLLPEEKALVSEATRTL